LELAALDCLGRLVVDHTTARGIRADLTLERAGELCRIVGKQPRQ
jgi:hypothetical protein